MKKKNREENGGASWILIQAGSMLPEDFAASAN